MSAVPLFEPTIVPRRLIVSPPLSDLEFERFCLKNDSVQIVSVTTVPDVTVVTGPDA